MNEEEMEAEIARLQAQLAGCTSAGTAAGEPSSLVRREGRGRGRGAQGVSPPIPLQTQCSSAHPAYVHAPSLKVQGPSPLGQPARRSLSRPRPPWPLSQLPRSLPSPMPRPPPPLPQLQLAPRWLSWLPSWRSFSLRTNAWPAVGPTGLPATHRRTCQTGWPGIRQCPCSVPLLKTVCDGLLICSSNSALLLSQHSSARLIRAAPPPCSTGHRAGAHSAGLEDPRPALHVHL